jgi:hypothetical protein
MSLTAGSLGAYIFICSLRILARKLDSEYIEVVYKSYRRFLPRQLIEPTAMRERLLEATIAAEEDS